MERNELTKATTELKSALRGVAEPIRESNMADGARVQLEQCLIEPKPECTDEATENHFNKVLNFLLDLETKIKKNAAANAPTYGPILGIPTWPLQKVERRRRTLEDAFRAYKAARREAKLSSPLA